MILGNEHLGPWEMADNDEREPVAPYCEGPGHAFDFDDDDWLVVVEPCPACARGPVRNHLAWRLPEGVDL